MGIESHGALGVADKHSKLGTLYQTSAYHTPKSSSVAWSKLTPEDAELTHCPVCRVYSFRIILSLNWHENRRLLNWAKLRVLRRERNYNAESSGWFPEWKMYFDFSKNVGDDFLKRHIIITKLAQFRVSKMCTFLAFSLNCTSKPKKKKRDPS